MINTDERLQQNFNFPGKNKDIHIETPPIAEIKPGDILLARYNTSVWARYFPWEDWHHAALVSKVNPLTIIEAAGIDTEAQKAGPSEVLFNDSIGFGKAVGVQEILWLKPLFPSVIRKAERRETPLSKREILTEKEARTLVIEYARNQLGEPYSEKVSKWNENEWYCSSLVYKSYSRTVSGMYLESSDSAIRRGFYVTPEDLLKSKFTKQYFSWIYKDKQDNII